MTSIAWRWVLARRASGSYAAEVGHQGSQALVDDHAARQFGIAFATPQLGWVGTTTSGFQTTDGGQTWTRMNMGRAVNKIRLLPAADGLVGYAIGVDVFKLNVPIAQ